MYKTNMEEILSTLLWCHITIFLFLIYQYLWKSFLKIKDNTNSKVLIDNSLDKLQDSSSEELIEEQDTNTNIPTHFKEYLSGLGHDHFGKTIHIVLEQTKNNVMFLSDDDIKSMNPVQLHKYLMKLFSFESDYVKFKLQLPDIINYKIIEDKTDKDIMIKYIIHIKYTLENWNNTNTKNSMESMLAGMMPMMTLLTGAKEVAIDKRVEVEEMSELEKEMGLVLNT